MPVFDTASHGFIVARPQLTFLKTGISGVTSSVIAGVQDARRHDVADVVVSEEGAYPSVHGTAVHRPFVVTVAAVGAGWPVVAIAPRGPASTPWLDALGAFKERGARLIVVSDDDRALAKADAALPLWTRVPEWLSPLVAVFRASWRRAAWHSSAASTSTHRSGCTRSR